jgi:hypothetical protein
MFSPERDEVGCEEWADAAFVLVALATILPNDVRF